MNELEHIFKENGVRLTAVRGMVWKTICSFDFVFSMNDVEAALPFLDKSSIFRTLRVFEEHGMLNQIDDGTGLQKYCISDTHHHEFHVHLSCENCHKTYCLKSEKVPQVAIPQGFVVQQISYVIKGICPECAALLKQK
ncbi:MAG: transcriptional repressor [Bacteroidales bacterium]|nr:transcriptional repressor [Bacteroidales bacterium]